MVPTRRATLRRFARSHCGSRRAAPLRRPIRRPACPTTVPPCTHMRSGSAAPPRHLRDLDFATRELEVDAEPRTLCALPLRCFLVCSLRLPSPLPLLPPSLACVPLAAGTTRQVTTTSLIVALFKATVHATHLLGGVAAPLALVVLDLDQRHAQHEQADEHADQHTNAD